MLEKTITNTFNRPFYGYWVNTELSKNTAKEINIIQEKLKTNLGDALWMTPTETLHISIVNTLDLPLLTETENESIKKVYDQVLRTIVTNTKPAIIKFSKIVASPEAIFIQADNNETIKQMRDQFLIGIKDRLPTELVLPRTPNIIHVTIARYTKALDLETTKKVSDTLEINFTEEITALRLVKVQPLPSVASDVIRAYPLLVQPPANL
ncbi:hypothetical protein KA517_00900 [Candidatus Gracilibacteria bacterium]|nr:hypothetical protein [Candidatus Gracilibacteria bacterium]